METINTIEQDDSKYLFASSLMQINLSKRLWIEMETFTNYFSEIFRKKFNQFCPEELFKKWNIDLILVENEIYKYILTRYFAWKIDFLLDKQPIYE